MPVARGWGCGVRGARASKPGLSGRALNEMGETAKRWETARRKSGLPTTCTCLSRPHRQHPHLSAPFTEEDSGDSGVGPEQILTLEG